MSEYLLLGIYSVPIRISSPELHVWDTSLLDEINSMERYVITTYRLRELFKYLCALLGIRIIYVSICVHTS